MAAKGKCHNRRVWQCQKTPADHLICLYAVLTGRTALCSRQREAIHIERAAAAEAKDLRGKDGRRRKIGRNSPVSWSTHLDEKDVREEMTAPKGRLTGFDTAWQHRKSVHLTTPDCRANASLIGTGQAGVPTSKSLWPCAAALHPCAMDDLHLTLYTCRLAGLARIADRSMSRVVGGHDVL